MECWLTPLRWLARTIATTIAQRLRRLTFGHPNSAMRATEDVQWFARPEKASFNKLQL
jgi:hypothetical protein